MATLEKRLDALETKITPPFKVCFWYRNENEPETWREGDFCSFGYDSPTSEKCDSCPAHKIIMVFVGGCEE